MLKLAGDCQSDQFSSDVSTDLTVSSVDKPKLTKYSRVMEGRRCYGAARDCANCLSMMRNEKCDQNSTNSCCCAECRGLELRRCTGCQVVAYCSKLCQLPDRALEDQRQGLVSDPLRQDQSPCCGAPGGSVQGLRPRQEWEVLRESRHQEQSYRQLLQRVWLPHGD